VGRGFRKDKGKKEIEITIPFWTSKQSLSFGRAVLFNILYPWFGGGGSSMT
jgi:hypothetical protein